MVKIKTINISNVRDFVDLTKFQLGIVAAKFNPEIVDLLLEGALNEASVQGILPDNVTVVRVPGAFELGYAARRLIAKRPHAVVALGSVIRGETSHYDYVCESSARGIQAAAVDSNIPVIFGVLTTENTDQAIIRAHPEQRNKGGQAVKDALELVAVNNALANLQTSL